MRILARQVFTTTVKNDGAFKKRDRLSSPATALKRRACLNSTCRQCPNGVANTNGLVGKYLMVHTNHGAYGEFEDEIRWYKAPPSLALTEQWNYTDGGKNFFGGYLIASQGPLVRE